MTHTDRAWTRDNSVDSFYDLEAALNRFSDDLPGWWLSIGECSVSCHASCAPDRAGRDAYLLADREFDAGFDVDLAQPSTLAEAVDAVREAAVAARRARR